MIIKTQRKEKNKQCTKHTKHTKHNNSLDFNFKHFVPHTKVPSAPFFLFLNVSFSCGYNTRQHNLLSFILAQIYNISLFVVCISAIIVFGIKFKSITVIVFAITVVTCITIGIDIGIAGGIASVVLVVGIGISISI